MPAGVIEINEDDEISYYEKIGVTCTEKALLNTFGGWVLDPDIEHEDLQCVPAGFCNIEKNKAPIPVEDGDKHVLFAPFKDFLGETLVHFGPVEVGGQIFGYCKIPGNLSSTKCCFQLNANIQGIFLSQQLCH